MFPLFWEHINFHLHRAAATLGFLNKAFLSSSTVRNVQLMGDPFSRYRGEISKKMFGNPSASGCFFPTLPGSSPSPPGKNQFVTYKDVFENFRQQTMLLKWWVLRSLRNNVSDCQKQVFSKKKDFGNLSLQQAGGKGALRRWDSTCQKQTKKTDMPLVVSSNPGHLNHPTYCASTKIVIQIRKKETWQEIESFQFWDSFGVFGVETPTYPQWLYSFERFWGALIWF